MLRSKDYVEKTATAMIWSAKTRSKNSFGGTSPQISQQGRQNGQVNSLLKSSSRPKPVKSPVYPYSRLRYNTSAPTSYSMQRADAIFRSDRSPTPATSDHDYACPPSHSNVPNPGCQSQQKNCVDDTSCLDEPDAISTGDKSKAPAADHEYACRPSDPKKMKITSSSCYHHEKQHQLFNEFKVVQTSGSSRSMKDIHQFIPPCGDSTFPPGWNASNVDGDGNCYFRCISLALFGHETYHKDVRNRVVNFMIEHGSVFANLLPRGTHFFDHIMRMLSTSGERSSWATEIEIFATATLLQCPIYVWCKYGQEMRWVRYQPRFVIPNYGPGHSYITIINIENIHFMLAVPPDSECYCQHPPPVLESDSVEGSSSTSTTAMRFSHDTCKSSSVMSVTPPSHNEGTSESRGPPPTKVSSISPSAKALPSSFKISTNKEDTTSALPSCRNACTSPPAISVAPQSPPADVSEAQLPMSQSKSKARKTSASSCSLSPTMSAAARSETLYDYFPKFYDAIYQGPTLECHSCKKTFYPPGTLRQTELLPNQRKLVPSSDAYSVLLCTPCRTSVKNNKMPKASWVNNLDAGVVPSCLKNLNTIEQRLISKVHAYLKMVILPYGQHAIDGQVINFPFDISSEAEKLCSSGVILVKLSNSKQDVPKEFVADSNKIRAALDWLKKNNPLYSDLIIESAITQPEEVTLDVGEEKSTADAKAVPDLNEHSAAIPETSVTDKDPTIPLIDFKEKIIGNDKATFTLGRSTKPPVNMFIDKTLEQLAFPHLFPYGRNGLRTPRSVRLTPLQYFQSRLLSKESRWANNIPYLFWTTNFTEKEKLSSSISIANRTRTKKSHANNTAGKMRDAVSKNPDYPENYYGFMKSIRGSASYWNSVKLDVFTLINTLGPPTWFLTLSANDMHWNDLMAVLCEQMNLPHAPEDLEKMPQRDKVKLMTSNPITTARHFSRRVHHFVNSIILSEARPLGEVTNYFWRVEFQLRGSPHIHSLWWIKDAPNLDTVEGLRRAPSFIDKYVSADIPEEDSLLRRRVLALQSHHHTKTCRAKNKSKSGNSVCRFNFPQPLSQHTVMKDRDEMMRSARCYIIKRKAGAEFINPYNPVLLKAWNANIDIQMVGSAYGAAKYICSYICKEETDSLGNSIHRALDKLPDDASFRQQLAAVGNVFLTNRQLSAQEAAYKMCGLPLRCTSRQIVYLDAKPEKLRCRLLKSREHLEKLADDSTDIFHDNVMTRYPYRPSELESISLYEYASQFKFTKEEPKNSSESVDVHCLLNNNGYIKKKAQPALIRTPHLSPEVNGDLYYHSMLLLHLPWRNEKDIMSDFPSAKEAFFNCKEKLKIPDSTFGEEIQRAVRQIQLLQDEVQKNYINPAVAPNAETINIQPCSNPVSPCHASQVDIMCPDESFQSDDHMPLDKNCGEASRTMRYNFDGEEMAEFSIIRNARMSDEEFHSKVSAMNKEQHAVYSTIKDFFIKDYQFRNGELDHAPDKLRLYVSGPGGTGKSFLISIIQEYVSRVTRSIDSMVTVTMAPTGVAAFNVHGVTLHSGLHLPVQHGKAAKFVPLSGENLQLIRKEWKDVQLIIIDEISMVNYEMLDHVNRRINEIRGLSEHPSATFGKISLLVFGDLYQLPPVHGKFIFDQKACKVGRHLWRDEFSLIELKRSMRQADDEQYATLLNRIRLGEPTEEDVILLQSRLTDSVYPINLRDEKFKGALYLYPTVKQCNDHNSNQLRLLTPDHEIVTVEAAHAFADTGSCRNLNVHDAVPVSLIPVDDRDCAGLVKTLHIAVGAIVMLRRNVNQADGLVNGARGVVKEICWDETHISVKTIYVQFFDPSIGHMSADCSRSDSAVGICPVVARFYGKRNTTILRTQFPLSLSWACTIHKVQGLTLDSVVVDLGDKIFANGMSYVALSRVKSLTGLALIDFSRKSIKSCDAVGQEMNRLRQLISRCTSEE